MIPTTRSFPPSFEPGSEMTVRHLLLPLMLFGCASPGALGPAEGQADLAKEISDRAAGPSRSCVPASPSQSLDVVDSRTLVVRSGGTLWVNRLAENCPGLRPFNPVIVEVQGSSYCRGDRVRGREPGLTIPGPSCPLRDFVPYRRSR